MTEVRRLAGISTWSGSSSEPIAGQSTEHGEVMSRSDMERCGARSLAPQAKSEGERPDVPWWLIRARPEEEIVPPSDGADPFLADLLKERGFDGHPELVTKEQLEEHVSNGEPLLFRGVTSPEYAEQFRRGDLYPGTGSAGNGIYCTYRVHYARDKATGEGEVMRMTLKSGAEIADEFQIDAEMHREREALKRQVDADPSFAAEA